MGCSGEYLTNLSNFSHPSTTALEDRFTGGQALDMVYADEDTCYE